MQQVLEYYYLINNGKNIKNQKMIICVHLIICYKIKEFNAILEKHQHK